MQLKQNRVRVQATCDADLTTCCIVSIFTMNFHRQDHIIRTRINDVQKIRRHLVNTKRFLMLVQQVESSGSDSIPVKPSKTLKLKEFKQHRKFQLFKIGIDGRGGKSWESWDPIFESYPMHTVTMLLLGVGDISIWVSSK